MELTLLKQNEQWLLYEKTKNAKIPRGKIEFLPQLHQFRVLFNEKDLVIHVLSDNNFMNIYKLTTPDNQYKGIRTDRKILQKIIWKEIPTTNAKLKVIKKLASIIVYYNGKKIANLSKKHNNYLSFSSKNDTILETITIISSFIPFIF